MNRYDEYFVRQLRLGKDPETDHLILSMMRNTPIRFAIILSVALFAHSLLEIGLDQRLGITSTIISLLAHSGLLIALIVIP